MGIKNTAAGARALFAALASATVVTATAHSLPANDVAASSPQPQDAQFTLVIPGAPGAQARSAPSAEDMKELDTLHKAAVASIAKRNGERCMGLLNTSTEGPLGNEQLDKVLALDEVGKTRPGITTPSKVMLVAADKAGYSICFDKRLARSEHVAALYIKDKVIALNPVAQNADKPVTAQQQALATSLQYVYRFWTQGITEQMAQMPIAISMHPGSYSSDFYITQWGVRNLMPAPVADFSMPKDPNEEKRKWMQQAQLRAPSPAG